MLGNSLFLPWSIRRNDSEFRRNDTGNDITKAEKQFGIQLCFPTDFIRRTKLGVGVFRLSIPYEFITDCRIYSGYALSMAEQPQNHKTFIPARFGDFYRVRSFRIVVYRRFQRMRLYFFHYTVFHSKQRR